MTRILTATLLALAAATPALPDEAGHDSYMIACSICHGSEGKGDGAYAPLLKVAPPDLTTIAERNGGTFPFLDVLMIVDGRSGVRAHGDSAMPIWGNVFTDSAADAGPYGAEVIARGRILSIVYYLEEIQVK
jgi:mono/diheme cytochrome c family protein